MPQPPESTFNNIASLKPLLHDENSSQAPSCLVAQGLETDVGTTRQKSISSRKSSDRQRGVAFHDACPAEFLASVDHGLNVLRNHLLRTFAEYSTESNRIQASPAHLMGRHGESMQLHWNCSKETVFRSNATEVSSSCILDNESCHIDENPSYRGSCVSEGRESFTFAKSTSDLSDASAMDTRERNQSRWVRFVQLVVTLGKAQFQLHPCWADTSENVEDGLSSVRNTVNQVGTQRQKVDEILHDWDVQQHKGLRTNSVSRSSLALPGAESPGMRKRRAHKYVLHPLSTKRIAWSLIGVVCIIYDAIIFSLLVFDMDESAALDTMDWIIRVYWIIDIGISFRTGFYVKARYEDSPPKIAKSYLSSWFLIDIIAVVPDWFITLLENSSDIGDYSQAFRYVKLCKMLRLVRMAKMASWLHNYVESLNSIDLQLSLHILKYASMVIFWVHCCGCMWFAIAARQDDSWISRNNVSQLKFPVTYFISVQWAFAQLQGNTDIVAAFTVLERALCSLVIMLSIFVLAVFISNITNTLIQLQTAWGEKARQLRALQDYLYRHKVTPELSESVRKYCAEKLKVEKRLSFGEDDVTIMLPAGLRRALLVEVRAGMIKEGNPVLSALCRCHTAIFKKICCDIVEPLFVEPDELVYNYGDDCQATYFVAGGELVYDHINNQAMGDLVRTLKTTAVAKTSVGHEASAGSKCNRSTQPATLPRHDSKNLEGGSHVHKTFFRERMHAAGTIINSVPLESSQQVCEAALWTPWHHYGDLNAVGHSAFLIIDSHKFQVLVEHDPKLMHFGVAHAIRFCRVLNYTDICSDLLTSNDVLDALLKAGEIEEAVKSVGVRASIRASFRANTKSSSPGRLVTSV